MTAAARRIPKPAPPRDPAFLLFVDALARLAAKRQREASQKPES